MYFWFDNIYKKHYFPGLMNHVRENNEMWKEFYNSGLLKTIIIFIKY